MNDYNVGDLVEATKGERVVRDRIHRGDGTFFSTSHYLGAPIMFGPSSLKSYTEQGYTLKVIEKAAPKLPTEEGCYLDKEGDPWQMSAGVWLFGGLKYTTDDARDAAPFTRIEPVADTAAAVLADVRKFAWADGFTAQLAALDNKYGAKS